MSTLIKSLVARGFVEYEAETRRYRPSVRLAFVGNWALGSTDVIARIHSLSQKLHDESDETVIIGSENGLFCQYLSLVLSSHTLRFSLHPGMKRPLHRSGLGLMLLTLKQDGEIGRMVRRYNAEMSDETEPRSTPSEVLGWVHQARKQGWFLSTNRVVSGGGSLATLLRLPRAHTTLAIGFGGLSNKLNERADELRDILMRNVFEFSREKVSRTAPEKAIAL